MEGTIVAKLRTKFDTALGNKPVWYQTMRVRHESRFGLCHVTLAGGSHRRLCMTRCLSVTGSLGLDIGWGCAVFACCAALQLYMTISHAAGRFHMNTRAWVWLNWVYHGDGLKSSIGFLFFTSWSWLYFWLKIGASIHLKKFRERLQNVPKKF